MKMGVRSVSCSKYSTSERASAHLKQTTTFTALPSVASSSSSPFSPSCTKLLVLSSTFLGDLGGGGSPNPAFLVGTSRSASSSSPLSSSGKSDVSGSSEEWRAGRGLVDLAERCEASEALERAVLSVLLLLLEAAVDRLVGLSRPLDGCLTGLVLVRIVPEVRLFASSGLEGWRGRRGLSEELEPAVRRAVGVLGVLGLALISMVERALRLLAEADLRARFGGAREGS